MLFLTRLQLDIYSNSSWLFSYIELLYVLFHYPDLTIEKKSVWLGLKVKVLSPFA
jgi:hypothetical protein